MKEAAANTAFDPYTFRADFPALKVRCHGKPLVYLDNAATSQKPDYVIDAIRRYYSEENANVHRGVHYLSQLATERYENARKRAMRFLGAPVTCEIVFTKGTTDAINLVAQTYGRKHVGEGDEVLVSHMEHHSNIVPWQMLCKEKGATLKVIPINDRGELRLDEFEKCLSTKTKIVALTHVSNALGTVNPVKRMIDRAHERGALVLLDGAQAVPHMPVNVRELGCDFYACSGHKMYAPTGIGLLYGRATVFEAMPPYQTGGDMILSVTFEETKLNSLPYKFEAGTPNIAGAVGLGAAIEYLEEVGMDKIAAYEQELLAYATDALGTVPGLTLIGTAKEKAGVLSFTLDSAHPHDIGQLLDEEGVAVRAGHHCAQPVMERFGVPATARASLAAYNTKEDIDTLVEALHRVNKIFA